MVPATLGHYRVVRPIGAGGMGEVFLAEDTKLGRHVALKVLAHGSTADPERRDRFDREARAVAALNHPNIITIHSVEEQDGVLFLTMEFVEGKTLGELIPPQGMSLDQLLRVAIPLADAVGAAHQKGITHRDLKPANVMVGDEGRVKVLDFGLAKLREQSPVDGLAPTVTEGPVTGEGRIVGTVAYMSPEQAEGKPVDARSDVFSLGILLFEMATGRKPFAGETSMAVLSAIIKDTPASVTDVRPDLPREIGRVLRRCLAKDPEERYQTAKDLRNDLKLLKEDSDTAVVRPAAPRTRSITVAAMAVVAVLSVAGAWWYTGQPAAPAVQAFASITMRQLTNTGKASLAAISPDGRYVVHVDGDAGERSVWMRQVSTEGSVQIVPPAKGDYGGLAFSPDGQAVLYVFWPENGPVASLFQIPFLGGPPRKLLEDITTAPAFSADGTRMAFTRGPTNGEDVLVVANADGTGQRPLAPRARSDGYAHTRVAWSPDGTMIAAFAGEIPNQRSRIMLVNVETGRAQQFSDARFDSAGQLTWLGNGSALVFDAVQQAGGRFNTDSRIWSIAYPSGTLRRINSDDASYTSVAATAGGRTLVVVRDEVRASLWVAPDGDAARARPIVVSSNGLEGATGIDWTPDGRIVYSARTQGSIDVWIANGDGTQRKQLTSDPGLEAQAQVLPDGRRIVFTSRASGPADVVVQEIDLDGSNPHPIETGGGLFRGPIQVPGSHLYFKAMTEGRLVDYRVPIGGGPRAPVFADRTRLPPQFRVRSVSADERWAVGTYAEPESAGLAVVPIDGRGPVRRFPYTYTPGTGFGTTWAPGGQAIEDLVLRDGAVNLWRFPLDGSPPRPVTAFTSEQIINYRWSRDGKILAMSRGTESSDVVLITSDEKQE